MRILIFSKSFDPDIGGIETICIILAKQFIDLGHSVSVITDSPSSSNCLREYLFNVYRQPSASQILGLWKWCDIVFQINLEARKLWPLLVARKPLVIGLQTWIGSNGGEERLIHKLKRHLLSHATVVVACSDEIRKKCWSTATVIQNPYQSSIFQNNHQVKKRNKIVFLGRLVSDKGADLLISAFARLKCYEWHLSIVGSGPELTQLTRQVEEYGLSQSVSFLGALRGAELVKVLNEHEIMVIPSRWNEPFGIVALEGLASGCAVLASNCGGLPSAVGNAGILFKPGDLADLTAKLKDLIEDRTMRESSRVTAERHLLAFQEGVVAEKYLSIFNEILSSRTRKHFL